VGSAGRGQAWAARTGPPRRAAVPDTLITNDRPVDRDDLADLIFAAAA
jgi:hypothetical protein